MTVLEWLEKYLVDKGVLCGRQVQEILEIAAKPLCLIGFAGRLDTAVDSHPTDVLAALLLVAREAALRWAAVNPSEASWDMMFD